MANKQTNIKNLYRQGVSCSVYSIRDQAECKPTIFSIASFSAKERELCREQVGCPSPEMTRSQFIGQNYSRGPKEAERREWRLRASCRKYNSTHVLKEGEPKAF